MPTSTSSPQCIDDFIGAQAIVERARVALEAAWNVGNGCMFPHSLMVGGPGLGKTELARIVAKEMGVELVEALGQTIRCTAELNSVLLQAEGGCLLIDESHSLPMDIQIALLKVLQEGTIFLRSQATGGKVKTMQLKPFCLIAATTDEWAMTRPLIDRFRLILRFDFYSVAEMTLLITRRARSMEIALDDHVAELIAQRSKGTPRIAIRLFDACVRTMQAQSAASISNAVFERTCLLEQIDGLGLDAVEQKYLRFLKDAGGRLRVNVIASCLGLPRATLERSIEPFLIRERLIEKSEVGRCLTDQGWRHVG
jgi:holliday junction DNA helicase RuvB